MASEPSTIEQRLRLRLAVLYVLVAVLYLALLLQFFLTARLLWSPAERCPLPDGQPQRRYDDTGPRSPDTRNDRKAGHFAAHENPPARERAQTDEPASAPDGESQGNIWDFSKTWDRLNGGKPFASKYASNTRKHVREPDQSDDREESVLHREKRQSTWYRRRRQYTPPGGSGPGVDFYEKPQAKSDSDEFVWLTSYSRIPMDVLDEYCVAVKEHCPPGEKGSPGAPGLPGFKGDRGERGDRGLPGEIGPRGAQGFHGLVGPIGPKGEKGYPGKPGLDGRDGIPGEPGLDGVPGRDGIDGIPGRDGIPGIPGTPGRPGTNGTNGIPGLPGPKGPPGPAGPQGLPGPRGRRGVPGTPGEDGKPGVKAWLVNGTKNDTILVPPMINDKDQKTRLIVDEGHNVRLRCIAAGNPVPNITWLRADALPLNNKYLHQSSVPDVLDIYGVTRDKAGVYRCIANNGIPPKDTMDIKLEVAFPPLIKIKNQNIPTFNGSYALLECVIEAYPPPVNYWIHADNRRVEPTWKYKMRQREEGYTTIMTLNITYIEPSDYGRYKCVSKNEKRETEGDFNVFESDPSVATTTATEEQDYKIYGQPPPTPIAETDCESCKAMCEPPQPLCPTAGQPHTAHVGTVYVPMTLYLPKPKPRQDHCMIHQLGKPVLQRYSKEEQGAWYQDALPARDNENKYYATFMADNNHLYEYATRKDFHGNNVTFKHELHFDFTGNAHVVYNGSFYYHEARSNVIIKHNIAQNMTHGGIIHDLVQKNHLYSSELNFMDVTADENGLWVIYPGMYSNTTVIRKLDPYSMKTEYIWNITFPHRSVGDMFITCGVLYGVNSVTMTNTQISFAFDLYQNKQLDVDIPFSNPFRQSSMITYNPRLKKILSWDKGNQLAYPILFGTIDMGQPGE